MRGHPNILLKKSNLDSVPKLYQLMMRIFTLKEKLDGQSATETSPSFPKSASRNGICHDFSIFELVNAKKHRQDRN